jgi:hypothetical protein
MKIGYLISLLVVLHLALLTAAGGHEPKREHEGEREHDKKEDCHKFKGIIEKVLKELKELKHEHKELLELRARVHRLEAEISSECE